jgi:tRNA wybutosine-synthesizing protein 2
MMRVRAVPREKLPEIRHAGWVDRSRSPFAEGCTVWVPVKPGEPFDREIPRRVPFRGRGFYMVGDIAIIHGEKPTTSEVEEIAGYRHPRGILWIASLRDVTRIPDTELLWGEAGEVCHRENTYSYIFDPRKVMFSQGNRKEKMRVAEMVRSGPGHERVADMFAGIGYFSVPLAGAGARVHAMEINPVAFGYLTQTIHANGFSDRITTSLGDCRQLLSGTYDRIVMGHFDAVTMLSSALQHVTSGSIIHVHSIGPVEDQIRSQVEGTDFSASIHVHKVKKYRPHEWHIVQDVSIA